MSECELITAQKETVGLNEGGRPKTPSSEEGVLDKATLVGFTGRAGRPVYCQIEVQNGSVIRPIRVNLRIHRVPGQEGYQMLRMTILFLIGLVMQSASGEELISVDIDQLKEIAINAALLDHPELLPGDLVDGSNGMINILCLPKKWGDRCQAHFSFDIVSTTTKSVKREGDKCYEETNTKNVSVTVLPDGSVRDINNSGSGTSSKSIDCPADIDDEELELEPAPPG